MPDTHPAVAVATASRPCAHFDGTSYLWISMALSGSSWGSGALRYSGFRQFTVESWVYPQAIGSNPATLFAFTGSLGPTMSIQLVDQRLTVAGTLQCLGDQLVPTVYSDTAWQVPNDRWSHVAVVVTLQSSPQITIYINGALAGHATTASELLFVGVDSATIGAQAKGSSAQAATLQHGFFRGFSAISRSGATPDRQSKSPLTFPTPPIFNRSGPTKQPLGGLADGHRFGPTDR